MLICSDNEKKWHYCSAEKRASELCAGKNNCNERHNREIDSFKKERSRFFKRRNTTCAVFIHDSGKRAHWLTIRPLEQEPLSTYFDLTPKESEEGLNKRFDDCSIIDFDLDSLEKAWQECSDKPTCAYRVVEYQTSGLAKVLSIKQQNPQDKPNKAISFIPISSVPAMLSKISKTFDNARSL